MCMSNLWHPGLKQAGAEARKVPQIKLFLEKVDAFTVRKMVIAHPCLGLPGVLL